VEKVDKVEWTKDALNSLNGIYNFYSIKSEKASEFVLSEEHVEILKKRKKTGWMEHPKRIFGMK
jgi:hypothetical protein